MGPLLFLIFINDLPNHIVGASTILFADDATCFMSAGDDVSLFEVGQSVLGNLNEWFTVNGLKVNIEKTRFLEFKLRSVRYNRDRDLFPYLYNECPVANSQSAGFLGIQVDSALSWSDHIGQLIIKLNKAFFAMKRISRLLPVEAMITIYHAYVGSLLRYGVCVWGASSDAIRVFKAQKRFIRLILQKPPRYSCRNLFRACGILPFPCLYLLELASYAKDNISAWVAGRDMHNHNTRSRGLLRLQRHRTRAYERSPAYMGRKVFNRLPEALKQIDQKVKFKKQLHSWFLEKGFYSLDEFFNNDY